jgi:hypothetical protein
MVGHWGANEANAQRELVLALGALKADVVPLFLSLVLKATPMLETYNLVSLDVRGAGEVFAVLAGKATAGSREKREGRALASTAASRDMTLGAAARFVCEYGSKGYVLPALVFPD